MPRKIRISYNRDRHQVGQELDVENEEATTLVREGRAVYVDVEDPAKANVASTKPRQDDDAEADAKKATDNTADADAEEADAETRAVKKATKAAKAVGDGPDPAPGTGDTPTPSKATKSTRS